MRGLKIAVLEPTGKESGVRPEEVVFFLNRNDLMKMDHSVCVFASSCELTRQSVRMKSVMSNSLAETHFIIITLAR